MTRAWADWWRGATSLFSSPSIRGPTPLRLRAGAKSGANRDGRMPCLAVPVIARLDWAISNHRPHTDSRCRCYWMPSRA